MKITFFLINNIYIRILSTPILIPELQSCIKAYELIGLINEKEQEFHEAADYYQKAWTLSNEQNTRIGYRLAICYMKSHQYVEAIDISETLLQIEPELQSIKKEIMDKCKLSNI